jgi:hypothetical protein
MTSDAATGGRHRVRLGYMAPGYHSGSVSGLIPCTTLGWGGAVARPVSRTVGRGQKREKRPEWVAD